MKKNSMKKNLLSAIVVATLFGVLAIAAVAAKNSSASSTDASGKEQASAVKICPHSGLPCTGDGECEDDCEEE